LFAGFVAVALIWAGGVADADIVWTYYSEGEGQTLTGRLTTDGNLADAAIPGTTFYLLSIDTVIYNGTDITDASNWSSEDGAQGPPFSTDPYGSMTTVAPYQATITSTDLDSMSALDASVRNTVRLGRGTDQPGLSVTTRGKQDPELGFGLIFDFQPTSTTFAAIPEPSAFLCLGLICGGVGAIGWTRAVARRMKR
jgi:hypothetical protein